jgi:ribosomal protein S18 acetylase RimI-like enzyme
MTTDQAAAVQVWAAVASATLAVVLAVLTAIYVLLTRRLAESSMAQASGSIHERLYNQNLSLLTELARYPELRPFFYEKVMVHPAIPAKIQNRIKLVAEMYAGFLELIALHLDALPDTVRGEWRQFIFDAYEISPAVQQCFIDHRSWYSEVLHRILREVPEDRKRGRKITPTIRPMRHDDIDALMDIQHDAYRVQYYEKRDVLLNKLGLFPGGCWVCVVQNRVISYIFSHPSRLDSPPALDQEMAKLPDSPDTYYIHDVATHSAARGLGAAKLLCEKADAIARNGRFKQLALVAVQDSRDWWLQEQGFTRAEVTNELSAKLQSYSQGATYMRRDLAG